MGATKYEIYPQEIIDAAELLKSISHPARLKMVQMIAESETKEVSTSEILEQIPLSQSTISAHLKTLINVGVVNTRVVNSRNKCYLKYSLNNQAMLAMKTCLNYLIEKSKLDTTNVAFLQSLFSRYRESQELKRYYTV